jgi:hypothetical protein
MVPVYQKSNHFIDQRGSTVLFDGIPRNFRCAKYPSGNAIIQQLIVYGMTICRTLKDKK